MKKLLIAGAVAVVLLLPNCTPAKASTLGDILGSVANSYLGGYGASPYGLDYGGYGVSPYLGGGSGILSGLVGSLMGGSAYNPYLGYGGYGLPAYGQYPAANYGSVYSPYADPYVQYYANPYSYGNAYSNYGYYSNFGPYYRRGYRRY